MTATRSVPLVAACDDPEVLGFPLWPAQRRVLEGVERGGRLHAWCLGRRSGKSTMAALVALHNLLLCPDLDGRVRRGERRFAVCVATNHPQARLIVQAAQSIVEGSPLLSQMVERTTEDEIAFSNSTALRAFPCSSRGGRGWPISCLILDEAAHFVDAEGYQAADRVWQGLSPSAAQFGAGSKLVVSSTPWGDSGFFFDFFSRSQSGEIADSTAVHATTQEMNPEIEVSYLEAEEARDPHAFRAEFLAEFAGSGDSYLDFSLFDIGDHHDLPPSAGTGWIAGLDPAFASDPFGLAIVGRSLDDPAQLVIGTTRGLKPHRRQGGSFEETASVQEETLLEIVDLLEPYEVTTAYTDQHLAAGVIDRLGRSGVHTRQFSLTAQSKSAAFGELRSRLYSGQLTLPADPDLLAELRRLRTRFAAGSATVLTPRVAGSHCDRAVALAVACYAMRSSGGSGFVPEVPSHAPYEPSRSSRWDEFMGGRPGAEPGHDVEPPFPGDEEALGGWRGMEP
jgi:hypothetical protein